MRIPRDVTGLPGACFGGPATGPGGVGFPRARPGHVDGARQRDETNVESARGRFELAHEDAAAGRRILLGLIDGNRLPVGSNASILALAIADHPETPPELASRLAHQALAEAEEQGYQSELIGAHHSLYQLHKEHDLVSAVPHLEKARELEQQQFAEKTAQQLQAVEVQQKTWQLGRELREETARLLAEVETQKNYAEDANHAKMAILGITAHDLRDQIGSLLLGGGTDVLGHPTTGQPSAPRHPGGDVLGSGPGGAGVVEQPVGLRRDPGGHPGLPTGERGLDRIGRGGDRERRRHGGTEGPDRDRHAPRGEWRGGAARSAPG